MEKNLTLSDTTARKLYQTAQPELKEILLNTFGKATLEVKYIDALLTVETCIEAAGRTYNEVIPFPKPINDFQDWLNACAEAAVIMEAYNECRIPKWDGKQKKRTLWWDLTPNSGFGLSFGACVYVNSSASVPSRLHYLDESHTQLLVDRFPNVWKRLMTQPERHSLNTSNK